ncbi:MAG: MopE-related protein, partial [Patescibacteria group bacterium]
MKKKNERRLVNSLCGLIFIFGWGIFGCSDKNQCTFSDECGAGEACVNHHCVTGSSVSHETPDVPASSDSPSGGGNSDTTNPPPSTNPPPAACTPTGIEKCDGLDNDCDGLVDEDVLNDCGSCGPVPAEICNGEDDDCDGDVDEGLRNDCGHCGPIPPEECGNKLDDDCDGDIDEGCECKIVGETEVCEIGDLLGQCKFGERVCTHDYNWSHCMQVVFPEPEICNDWDDDCDGQIDEELINNCGQCGLPPAEICDGYDNDCDGDIDEGCECLIGQHRLCGTNIGLCQQGIETCVSYGSGVGHWSDCVGAIEPDVEICDGRDNNCDSVIDNGCACTIGETRSCGIDIGQCSRGIQTCVDNGAGLGTWSDCAGSFVGPDVEICDGQDNNCDGHIDEDLLNACGTCGQAPDEICDGEDNDCDSAIDEGCDCTVGWSRECGSDLGECVIGTQNCYDDGNGLGIWGTCEGAFVGPNMEICDGLDNDCDGDADEALLNMCGQCGVVPAEICDGVDNDCDGGIDEDCDCTIGQAKTCGTDMGQCEFGIQICYDLGNHMGYWGDCEEPFVGPSVEVCDGADNDCDGGIDEGCDCTIGIIRVCGSTMGVCELGTQECLDNGYGIGYWGECLNDTEPSVEICDGADNNCDGAIDEGCTCTIGQFIGCGSDLGECVRGTQECLDLGNGTGYWSDCGGSFVGPMTETCNGLDDDCDGDADEELLNACGTCGPVPAELCDGVDNDCDGDVDENCQCTIGQTESCGT